jgi:hypothetical protein
MKSTSIFYIYIAALIGIASCKPDKDDLIIGLWQEVKIVNPQIDNAIEEQRMFLDTVGKQTDSAANLALYGMSNIDSFKKNLQTNIDSYKRAQGKAISETWFDFHTNGLVYLHSEEGLDSAKWYFEDDGALMLDEEKLKGTGSKIRMEVEALNDTAMQLHYSEQYLSSTAHFRRVKR